MNIYGIIILCTLLCKHLITLAAQLLNLRSSNGELPGPVVDTYVPDEYVRAVNYTRTTTYFHIVESTIQLTILLIFWFAKGFDIVDQYVRGWGYGPILTGIFYIGILSVISVLLSLPFEIYSTFVIEERYGFNRTTLRTFIVDRIKALFLSIVLGVPLLSALLWFFGAFGDLAWLYCWFFAVFFALVIQFIAPVWILPMFNKYTPLPEGSLKQAIQAYAQSVNFKFKEITIVDASTRSSKANAFFIGFGRNKRIALFDTLVADQTEPEVLAVLAHEIGHQKRHHIPVMTLIALAQMGIIFYLLSVFLSSRGLFDAFYMQEMSVYGGLIFFGLLYEPVSFILHLFLNAASRRNEKDADRYAVQTLRESSNLISALKKLSTKNLTNLNPHPLYVALNYSHPPLLERIKAILDTEAALVSPG